MGFGFFGKTEKAARFVILAKGTETTADSSSHTSEEAPVADRWGNIVFPEFRIAGIRHFEG